MSKKRTLICSFVVLLGAGLFAANYLRGLDVAVLNPHGIVASKERSLMIVITLLMLIVVVPVFGLTFVIAWKYRESNRAATYAPEWDHNCLIEAVWWGVPLILLSVISVMTWQSSHALDPFRPLASRNVPLTIQVVALQWKWLFIYPEQNIATLNYVKFPQNTPVSFQITSDAPMNSFWIPQLGGQVYAMAGMSTQLHLMADGPGNYRGSSANLSGAGFAGMKFTATATSRADFDSWTRSVQRSAPQLTMADYDQLARPSQNNPTASYSAQPTGLYASILTKYMPSSLPMNGIMSSQAAHE